jgi:hypothetical protein
MNGVAGGENCRQAIDIHWKFVDERNRRRFHDSGILRATGERIRGVCLPRVVT